MERKKRRKIDCNSTEPNMTNHILFCLCFHLLAIKKIVQTFVVHYNCILTIHSKKFSIKIGCTNESFKNSPMINCKRFRMLEYI